MSEVLEINEEKFVTVSVAAHVVGYTTDYVARLAREEKIVAAKIGRQWTISLPDLVRYKNSADGEKMVWRENLRKERMEEQIESPRSSLSEYRGKVNALLATAAISVVGLMVGTFGYVLSGEMAESIHEGREFSPETLALSWYTFLASEGMEESRRITPPKGETPKPSSRNAAALPESTHEILYIPIESSPSEVQGSKANSQEEGELKSIKNSFSDRVKIVRDPENPDVAIVVPEIEGAEEAEERFFVLPMSLLKDGVTTTEEEGSVASSKEESN